MYTYEYKRIHKYGGDVTVSPFHWHTETPHNRLQSEMINLQSDLYGGIHAQTANSFNRQVRLLKKKSLLTNAPEVWGERRTHWGNPWGDLSSDSWRTARRVSQFVLCSGCSSPQTSVSPSTGKPAAQTGATVEPEIIRSDTGDRGKQVKQQSNRFNWTSTRSQAKIIKSANMQTDPELFVVVWGYIFGYIVYCC